MPVTKAKKTVSDFVEAPKVETKVAPKVETPKVEVKIEPKVENNRVGFVPSQVQPQVQRAPMPNPMPRIAVAPAPVQMAPEQTEIVVGVLDVQADGQGYVRPKFVPGPKDVYVPFQLIRKYGLRMGDMIAGASRVARENDKFQALVRIDSVNGDTWQNMLNRPDFNHLVPVYPEKQIKLESEGGVLSTRIMDLFSPIGFGQRGMIVSPPKAGKTTLLKDIAQGVAANYPNIHLMAILVGERPEEVTDMQRFIKGEVIASSFDQKPEDQTKAAEIGIERAKRLVELGKDVFIVFDSITRLARAYNLAIPTSGRTLSGGFDPVALYPSKKFFGAARKIEHGGSLTIIGTALVETGSKMDDLIFEEFKGTGNMELRLERELAERRVFPAFDIYKSGTRKEDLLLDPVVMQRVIAMRRAFDVMTEKLTASEMVIEQMGKTKTNEEFIGKFLGKK